MCANMDYFNTYEKNGGGDLMGKDAPCKVVGICTVKVKMYNSIIRTFDDMRHVPSLKKKLISLGALDANDYTHSSNGGKLKICKGSMVIMYERCF